MATPFGQWAFTAGELAPSLWGHVDFAKYHLGLSTCRNAFIGYRGGLYSRAGTAFVGFSKQTGRAYPPRLITFNFSVTQELALEFGNNYMRVISQGAFVTESPIAITGISNANPAVVTIANTWSVGDWIFISGVSGMTQVNGIIYQILAQTGTTVTLGDAYGLNVNSSAYGVYSSGGTAARIYTLSTPWAEADLPWLKFTQSADVMSICCWNQETGTSYQPQDLTRVTDSHWTLTALSTGSVITAPGWSGAVATVQANGAASPPLYPTAYAYVATAVDRATGQESVASPVANVTNSVDIAATAGSIAIYWSAVSGARYYNIYKAPPSFNSDPSSTTNANPVPAGSLFGYIGSSYSTQFIDSNIVQDLTQVPPLHVDPFSPGQILGLNITSPGSGVTSVTWTITSPGGGTGFTGYPVIISGSMTAFIVLDGGSGYAPGDSIAFNGAGFATGAITFGSNPANGDTVTLNGVVWTFVTTLTGANQIVIKATTALTVQKFANELSASGNALLTVASYTAGGSVLTIAYKTAGTAGNAYTLAASAATPSGATLTGGSGTSGTAPTATLIIGPQTGTWPSAVTYFQERRVYMSTPNQPDFYFMSQPGAFMNYDARVPTIDSDSVIGSPWSVQVNGIQFAIPMPGGLVVLTGKQAWQLTGAGGSSLSPQPITPANQQAQPQAFNGCSPNVPPIQIDNSIYFVQAKGSIIRDFTYVVFANIYTGNDNTYLSSHLFQGYKIREMAWCEEPFKLLWVVREDDGTLLSLTNLKAQEVMAWARHDTQGRFWSCCAVTEPPLDQLYDALYVATERFINGSDGYLIERMDNRIWPGVENVWAVDCGLSLPQPKPAATLICTNPWPGVPASITSLVGGTGYSAGTTATIRDPTGTGCVVGLTIVAGVITAVSLTGGTNYTSPQFIPTDPAGTGSGASGTVVLNNATTFATTIALTWHIGDVIRSKFGGKAVVASNAISSTITANIVQPFANFPNGGLPVQVTSGNWTLTTPTATVSGLNHLVGAAVTGLADGQVIPATTVSALGAITLSTAASAITVGLGFQAQAQSLYLEAGEPTMQGRRKKIAAVTARVEGSKGIKIGSNQPDGSAQNPMVLAPLWSNLQAAPDLGQPFYGDVTVPLYTGDVRIPVGGGYGKPGQVAFQQDNPLPMNIMAIVAETETGDTPESARAPNGGRGGRPAP